MTAAVTAAAPSALRYPPDADRPAVWLAAALLLLMSSPGLLDLPGGASLPLLAMLGGLPVWYATARARHSPFDPSAAAGIRIVLTVAACLVVWSILSVYGAESPLRGARYVLSLAGGFAFFLLIGSAITERRVETFVDLLAIGLALTCVVSLMAYEIAPLRHMIFGSTDRAAGFFKNPNQFGIAISTTLPGVLALILGTRRRRRRRILVAALLVLGLAASGSKTNLLLAWATMLAMLFAHAIVTRRGAARVRLILVYLACAVGIASLGIAALSVLNPRALLILERFFSPEGEVESLATRSLLWAYSFDQVRADPFFGEGAGQNIDIFYRAADVSHSHNMLLDYMRTLGIPGLTGIAVMIGTVACMSVASMWTALFLRRGHVFGRLACFGASLASLSYIASNMTSDSFGPSTSPFFWFFTFLALAARKLMPADRVVPGPPAAGLTR